MKLGALGDGKLDARMSGEYHGVLATLQGDTNQMASDLGELVRGIRERTFAIANASREIADGNRDLSARTEEQAASLEQTAASLEQLNSTVNQNAQSSKQAATLAAGASAAAARGGETVQQVVSTFGEIAESSKRIADILAVIDGIAFQTNILALNAAVEAARAGEQGRGFAVVAAEVRSLAQRSAGAAKEIKSLITDSSARLGAGSQLVATAGEQMQEIVAGVKRVTDIIDAISAAGSEQAGGIAEVNTTIRNMDSVTQQNAALVEEASAAAESLHEQAAALEQLVERFSVVDARAVASTPAKQGARGPRRVHA